MEIKAQAELHDLSELLGKISDTTQQLTHLHACIQVTTLETETADEKQGLYTDRTTKACPKKLLSFSGLISEDFVVFRDKFKKASIQLDHQEGSNREAKGVSHREGPTQPSSQRHQGHRRSLEIP